MNDFRKLLIVPVVAAVASVGVFDEAKAAFKDIRESFWAYEEINWAKNTGLVNGYADGTYKPNNTLTEAQFLAMLNRFAGEQISENVPAGTHWAENHYKFAEQNNIPVLSGSEPSQRNKPIRRGDIATVLAAYQGLDLNEYYAVMNLMKQGVSTGRNDQTYEGFDPDAFLNRGQVVTFLYRMNQLGLADFKGLDEKPNGKDNFKIDVHDDRGFKIKTADELVAETKALLEPLGFSVMKRENTSSYGIYAWERESKANITAYYRGKDEIYIGINGAREKSIREALSIVTTTLYPTVSKEKLDPFITSVYNQEGSEARIGSFEISDERLGNVEITYIFNHRFDRGTLSIVKK